MPQCTGHKHTHTHTQMFLNKTQMQILQLRTCFFFNKSEKLLPKIFDLHFCPRMAALFFFFFWLFSGLATGHSYVVSSSLTFLAFLQSDNTRFTCNEQLNVKPFVCCFSFSSWCSLTMCYFANNSITPN